MFGSKLSKVFYVLVALLILVPLIALSLQSLSDSDTFLFLVRTVLDDVVFNTVLITTLTSIGVLVFGISCAWFVVRYSFFGHKAFQLLLLMPLASPAYIMAYVYTDFFDAAGVFATTLKQSGLDMVLPNVRSVGGASFILTFCLYPYVYLFARNGFLATSQNQMESGELLGASRLSQFIDIVLPAARPYIIVGLMLVIMEVLADYGTMDYFGIRSFSTIIYDAWAGYGDITAAARLSLMLLGFVFLLVLAEKNQRQKMRFYALDGSKPTRNQKLKGNILISLWCFIPAFIGFIFPAFILLKMALEFMDFPGIEKTLPYLINSLTVCFIVAVIGVSVAFVLNAYKRGRIDKMINVLFAFCGFGYALPGIILGLGLLLVSSLFSALNILVTGTFAFLIFGYLIRFLNVPLQSLEAGYEKISPSIDQASMLMRHRMFDDFWQVKLPLLTPSMLSAGLILAVEVIKELPLTLVLRPFDFDTLAVHTYNLASDERLAEAAFPALCIVIAGCVPILILQHLERRSP